MIKRTLFAACGILLLLALFLFPSSHAYAATSQVKMPSMDFGTSCKNSSITAGGVLHSTCKTKNGVWHPTQLDLNGGVGNSNGALVFNDNGFLSTCINIGGNTTLHANCLTRSGQYAPTSHLDLNGDVNNFNGSLGWG
jgi:hypothetical protein